MMSWWFSDSNDKKKKEEEDRQVEAEKKRLKEIKDMEEKKKQAEVERKMERANEILIENNNKILNLEKQNKIKELDLNQEIADHNSTRKDLDMTRKDRDMIRKDRDMIRKDRNQVEKQRDEIRCCFIFCISIFIILHCIYFHNFGWMLERCQSKVPIRNSINICPMTNSIPMLNRSI